jgi:hypothetical protein
MATLTQTIKQYLKNQEQTIAVPTVAETKTRKMRGLFDRMEHTLWRIVLQWGIAPLPTPSDCQQLEFLYSSTFTPKEKVRLEADLMGL